VHSIAKMGHAVKFYFSCIDQHFFGLCSAVRKRAGSMPNQVFSAAVDSESASAGAIMLTAASSAS
jgi:hypothetical protein